MKKTLLITLFVFILTVLSVSAAGNLTILNHTQALSGNVLTTVRGNFTLNNTGAADLTGINFTATQLTGTQDNIPSSSISFTPSSYSLLNTTELKQIDFSVAIPPNQYADTYTATINASASEPGNYESFDFNLTVNEEAALTTTNPTISDLPKSFSKSATFTISNTGNTDLSNITITPTNLSSGSDNMSSTNVVLSKTSTSLNYTQSEVITVTVTAPSNQTSGTYTGNITIDYGAGTATATLTVTVRDVVSPRLTLSDSILTLSGKVNTNVSDTFIVNNIGDYDVNDITVSLSGLLSFNVDFNLNHTSFNLAAGEARTIKVDAAIPEEKDVGTYSGTVTVSNGTVSTSLKLNIKVESYLEINDLDIDVDGKSDNNVNDGDTIREEAEPGSLIEFDVKVKNTYDSDIEDDISDIENIFIRVTIEDIDDGDELEEETNEFDLDADRSHRETLTFRVPMGIDEGEYTVIVYIEGEDGNGVTQSDEFTLDLKVEKRTHDIIVYKTRLEEEKLTCNRETRLFVEVMNLGTRDEDEVVFRIQNSALGLNIREEVPYDLDSSYEDDDNTYSKYFPIKVSDTVSPGKYTIEIKTYYDTDKITNMEIVFLEIASCVTEEEEEEEEQQETEEGETEETTSEQGTSEQQQTQQQGPSVTQTTTTVVDTTRLKFRETSFYTVLLVIANIALLGGIVFGIAKVAIPKLR